MLFVLEEMGWRFEWDGGEFIEIFSNIPDIPNQEQALWINNQTMRPEGWYSTDVNINVWDYDKGEPRISMTELAFRQEIKRWLD